VYIAFFFKYFAESTFSILAFYRLRILLTPAFDKEHSFRRLSGHRLMYRRRYKKSAFPNREALSYPMNRLAAVWLG
jgi:hypothetical protein